VREKPARTLLSKKAPERRRGRQNNMGDGAAEGTATARSRGRHEADRGPGRVALGHSALPSQIRACGFVGYALTMEFLQNGTPQSCLLWRDRGRIACHQAWIEWRLTLFEPCPERWWGQSPKRSGKSVAWTNCGSAERHDWAAGNVEIRKWKDVRINGFPAASRRTQIAAAVVPVEFGPIYIQHGSLAHPLRRQRKWQSTA